jgi:hypothetical protein
MQSVLEGYGVNRALMIIGLGVVAFAVTLGVYVGSHLSNEATSVLTGAACGVGAMLPAALVAGLALMRRREREDIGRTPSWPQSAYPPVIVVAPPAVNAQQLPNSPYAPAPPVALPRQFTVIGDDPLDSHTQ